MANRLCQICLVPKCDENLYKNITFRKLDVDQESGSTAYRIKILEEFVEPPRVSKMASANTGRGLVGLWKRGWHEIPEVMASSAFGLFGLGLIVYSVKSYYAKDGDNRRYKDRYTVYRHDDPRVEKIKHY